MTYSFEAVLWGDDGEMSWVFASVPTDVADEIADLVPKRGFGSVRVEVAIGTKTWRTSLFPDSKRSTYVLPVKRAVRTAAEVEVGEEVAFTLTVIADLDDEA